MNKDARNTRATKTKRAAAVAPTANRAERYAAGKALRDRVPREQHGEWKAPKNRHDPVDLVIASSSSLRIFSSIFSPCRSREAKSICSSTLVSFEVVYWVLV